MKYQHVRVPTDGVRISVQDDQLVVSDTPIIPFIQGDGIGRDISAAARRILDAALEKTYGSQRRIACVTSGSADQGHVPEWQRPRLRTATAPLTLRPGDGRSRWSQT